MRKVVVDLRETLLRGLRAEPEYTLNSGVLEDIVGFVLSVYGLRGKDWEELTFDNVQNAFPFPQLVKAGGSLFVGTSSKLYKYDGVLEELPVEVIPGGVWRGASFGVGYTFTNGSCIVHSYDGSNPVVLQKRAVDIIEHSGRFLFGGLRDFFGTKFKSMMTMLTGDFFDGDSDSAVYWTSVGGWDLPIHFEDEINTDTLREYIERNDSGFLRLDGNVVRLLELTNDVIAYTDKGVFMLRAITTPFPSYSISKITDIPVMAAGGGIKGHMFVGEDKVLYSLSSDGLKRLGYKEYIVDDTIEISYDDLTGTFFISSRFYTLVYRNVMTKVKEVVTSCELGKVLVTIT